MNQTTKIWMCEDLGDMTQSKFAQTKEQAERLVADNRGYDSSDEAGTDGWLNSAIQIEVDKVVAAVLLKRQD